MRTFLIVLASVIVVGLGVAAAMPIVYDPEVLALDDESRRAAPGLFAELTDGLSHYELAGPSAGLPVVLIHGGSVPYYIWDDTFAALRDGGYRVLRYDQFGRGWSDRPDSTYDRGLFERQLYEMIAAAELQTPVVLAGVSLGGAVAVGFADAFPDLVRALVLVDPLHEGVDVGMLRRPVIGPWLMSVSVAPGMPEGQLDDFYRPEAAPADWVERYREQMRYRGWRSATLSIYRNFVGENHASRYESVGDRGTPALLIWGRHDRVLPYSQNEVVRLRLRPQQFITIEDAGHIPQVEQPEATNAVILEYLKGLLPAGAAPAEARATPEDGR